MTPFHEVSCEEPSKEIPHSVVEVVNDYIRRVPPQHGDTMTSEEKNRVGMAECGSCRAVIPIDSSSCPECGTSFQGVSDEALGECGACKSLVPLDSTRCPSCGVLFVADDVVDVLRQWVTTTGIDLRKLFDKFDENSDGMIDATELREGLLSLNLADLPPTQVDRLVNEIDEDDNGVIDLDEFIEILTSDDHETNDSSTGSAVEQDEASVDADVNEMEEDEEGESDDSSNEHHEEVEETEEPLEEAEDSDDHTHDEEIGGDQEPHHDEGAAHPNPLQTLVDMMDEMGISAQRVFNDLDRDGDGAISMTELATLLERDYGEGLDMEAIESLMASFDEDGDGTVDLTEFWESMESLDNDDHSEPEEETDYFPTPMQKRMMSKQWNDAVWPILHTGFILFFVVLMVNALVGPVDGTGGTVVYEPIENGVRPFGVEPGDTFPCDEKYQLGGCGNSLTPLAGESSSMPKGFYWDGIVLIALSLAGMSWSLFMHLVRVPAWRARARAMKEFDSDKADASKDKSEDEQKELVDLESSKDDEEGEDLEPESEDDGDHIEENEESHDDEEQESADEIDIGSHIGLEFDGEEVFGTIVEFDDEEETVTIEEDGTGDLITGYQEDMFVE